jgi:hypothetical protein
LLFEVLIALSLTAILLTFLFSFFAESAKLEKKIDAAREQISGRQRLQTRLQAIFSSLCSDGPSPFFYTRTFKQEPNPSLIAIYDNGIDPDPAFSGSVLGKLFLDGENLSLVNWPNEPEQKMELPWRKEILLSGVERFEFEFLSPKKEEGPKEKIKPINPFWEWRYRWPKKKGGIPPLVRLFVWEKGQKEPLRFAFFIPCAEPIPSCPSYQSSRQSSHRKGS